jgi:hypothetical protein
LTTTRRIRPLVVVQLGKLVVSVALVCLLAELYGVTGAAVSNLLTSVLSLGAAYVVQSAVRRSVDQHQQTTAALRTCEAVQRRLTKNAKFLLLISPARHPSSFTQLTESSERLSSVGERSDVGER